MNRLLYLHLFIISLLFIPAIGFSQSQYAKVSWRKIQKKAEKTKFLTSTFGNVEIIGNDKSGMLFTIEEKRIKKNKTKYFLESYNGALAKVKTSELQIDSEKETYNDVLLHNDKLILFTNFLNEKLKKDFLFMQELDKSTLAPIGEKKMIMEVDISKNPLPAKFLLLGRAVHQGLASSSSTPKNELIKRLGYTFKIERLNDSSDIAVIYELPVKRKEKRKLKISLFDKELKLEVEKIYELPYLDKEFYFWRYDIDQRGTVYLVGLNEKSRKNNIKTIFSLSNKLDDIKEHKLPSTKDFKMRGIKYDFSGDEKIRVYGIYEKYVSSKKNEIGFYFISIDRASSKIERVNFTPLEDEYQEKFQREKGSDYNYIGFSCTERKNEGVIMTLENKSVTSSSSTMYNGAGDRNSPSNNTTSTTVRRYFNDIIVLDIDRDGEIQWSTLISKKQHTKDATAEFLTHISFYKQIVGNNLYLIFPDNANNKKVEEDKNSMQNYNQKAKLGMLAVVAIDLNTGEAKKEKVYGFLPKKQKEWIMPSKTYKLSETEALIYAEGVDTFKIGKITFKP